MAINIGIGIPFIRGGGSSIDAQAQAHYDRVIAAGGIVPAGLEGCSDYFKAMKLIYSVSNLETVCPANYNAHYLGGIYTGTGAGAASGLGCSRLFAIKSDGSYDLLQATAASQPLSLVHEGTNYWFGSGVNGNYCSTPNAAANQITGDIEIIANFSLNNLATDQTLIAKDNISNRFYNLVYVGTDSGKIYFGRNIGGTWAYSISTVASGFALNTKYWLKANRVASTGEVKIFTSTDGINYTQLGATISSTAGNLTTGSIEVGVGCLSNNAALNFTGKIYRATISNSIGGAPVVDFNPARLAPATSQTQFTASTGEVWTANNDTNSTGYKGTFVWVSGVMSDGVNDALQPSSNILNFVNATTYNVFRRFEITGSNKSIISYGNNPNEIDVKHTNNIINSTNNSSYLTKVNLQTLRRNEASNQGLFRTNNTSEVINTITPTGTNLNRVYLCTSPYGQAGNGIITSVIVSINIDDNTIMTAMYNTLNTFNGGALV